MLQELAPAKALCKLLIVTDGDKSYWINTLTSEEVTEQNGTRLKTFNAMDIINNKLTEEQIVELEDLLDRINHSLCK